MSASSGPQAHAPHHSRKSCSFGSYIAHGRYTMGESCRRVARIVSRAESDGPGSGDDVWNKYVRCISYSVSSVVDTDGSGGPESSCGDPSSLCHTPVLLCSRLDMVPQGQERSEYKRSAAGQPHDCLWKWFSLFGDDLRLSKASVIRKIVCPHLKSCY